MELSPKQFALVQAARADGTTWTPARTQAAVMLWRKGWSAGEIVENIGGCSRNAVIGKMHRMGEKKRTRQFYNPKGKQFKPRSVEISKLLKQPKKSYPPKQAEAKKPERKNRNGHNTSDPDRAEKVKAAYETIEKNVFQDVPGSVSIEELSDCHCRWPVDAQSGEIRFCGATPAEGQKYCSHHAQIAFVAKPLPRIERPYEAKYVPTRSIERAA